MHSTVLGPAVGGLRLSQYASLDDAVSDALELARTMTLKNAAAGLDLGGGKAVLVNDGEWADPSVRSSRLLAFGRKLEALAGTYITAEDVGTTPDDMQVIATVTDHVTGLPGRSGDPSLATATTVVAAIRDAVDVHLNRALPSVSVGVLGVGHVGARVTRMLVDAGARVLVADLDPERASAVARCTSSAVRSVDEIVGCDVDVLAPCALGGSIGASHLLGLRCRVIAGAANNPLTSDEVASELARAGILYVPDFLANCGGIIHVGGDVLGLDASAVAERMSAAQAQTRELLKAAVASGRQPLELARALADRRLRRGAQTVA